MLIMLEEIEEKYEKVDKNTFVPKTLRIFISYSKDDKLIAGAIKDAFLHFGHNAFLAHEDIPPGEKWASEIKKHIRQVDIFLAALSKSFHISEWADQETGMAISNSKFVIPVSIDGTLPYGFMSDYQAFRKFECNHYKSSDGPEHVNCHNSVFEVIKFLGAKEEFKDNIRDGLIVSLSSARSFRDAEEHMKYLLDFEPFAIDQINEIIKRSISNTQVHDAYGCKNNLKYLLAKYSSVIKKNLQEQIKPLIEE